MSGDNFSDSMSGARRVLGEITNLPAKRGASSDLIAGTESGEHSKRKKGPAVGELALTVGDASRDSCCGSSGGIPMSCKNTDDDEGGYTSDLVDSSAVGPGSLACNLASDDQNLGVVGQLESSGMPDSQPRKLFELNRCTRTQANGCANMNDGDDILKTCPCSFCIQATYIWSDLHYQDMKGRLAALKKSQKEARSLVNNYAKDMLSDDRSCRGGPSVSAKLESDLTDQWRSLFHHMEDIFVHETNELQSTFAMLKDMKEDCKMDLERIAGVPSDGH